MEWISKHKNIVRVALLILLVGAMLGPWFYETMFTDAPPEGPCPAPLVFLGYGNCAMRMPGTLLLAMMVGGFFGMLGGAVTGTVELASRLREFLVLSLVFVFVLPFISTLLLALRRDSRHLRIFNMAAWGMAAVLATVMVVFVPGLHPAYFWGIWLYLAVAVAALALELLGLVAKGPLPSPQS
jgi:hypothetical protein